MDSLAKIDTEQMVQGAGALSLSQKNRNPSEQKIDLFWNRSGIGTHQAARIKMSKLTKEFLSLIPLGSQLIVKDIDDGDFEGTLNTPITFESSKTFTVTLDKCRRVGSSKFQPGSQEFDSETIEDIELINDATSDQDSVEATTKALEQKIKLNEGGKVFPVGGNVARKVHRNDNPHLDRLHPPQMEELVAQKQVRFLHMTPLIVMSPS